MKQLLNLPNLLLSSLIVKIIITGAGIGESIAILGLAALCGAYTYIESKKQPDVNEVFKKEQVKVREELEVIKAAMSSLKLGVGFRK